jgi:hypothetical protein
VVETTLALDNYKRACDSGRGAVFLSVARGKVAEGIDFDRHYGRCVVIFGIPYQYTLSHVLRARLNYMRERYGIRDNDFLTFDALRQAAQCVGRVIRSKTDYGIVVLADSRYNRADKRSKFPPWILQFVKESSLNLPTDSAVDQIKSFLRVMGQPIDQEALHSILLNESQVSSMFQFHKLPPSATLLGEEMKAAQVAAGFAAASTAGAEPAERVEDMVIYGSASASDQATMSSDQRQLGMQSVRTDSADGDGDDDEDAYGYGAVDADGNYLPCPSSSTKQPPATAPAASSSDSGTTMTAGVVAGGVGIMTKRPAGPVGRSVFLFEDILDASDGE